MIGFRYKQPLADRNDIVRQRFACGGGKQPQVADGCWDIDCYVNLGDVLRMNGNGVIVNLQKTKKMTKDFANILDINVQWYTTKTLGKRPNRGKGSRYGQAPY